MKKFKYSQYVLVEFKNSAIFAYIIESNKKITLTKVVKYFEITERWTEERDSINFIDKPSKIHI